MKCPACNVDLQPGRASGVDAEICPACKGIWFTRQELEQLEDEVFDFGDDEKGSLMLGATAIDLNCPQCAKTMKSFQYRLYDLPMDYCEDGHGFWLTAGEDKRVLDLMRKEEKDLGRKVLAEDRWAAHTQYLLSGSFRDRIRDLLRDAIDPKPKVAKPPE